MAKYRLIKQRDGNYSVRGTLSLRGYSFIQAGVSNVPPDGVRAAVVAVAERVQTARIVHGLSEVSTGIAGDTQ